MVIHRLGEVVFRFDFLAVNSDDQVASEHDGGIAEISALAASAKSGLVCRATGNNLHD